LGLLAGSIDEILKLLDLLLGEGLVSLIDQGCDRVFDRTSEEGVYEPGQGPLSFRLSGNGGTIDELAADHLMSDNSFFLEDSKEGSHGCVRRLIRKGGHYLVCGVAVSGIQNFHDLLFPFAEVGVVRLGHG
jgi:hypothetical protein